MALQYPPSRQDNVVDTYHGHQVTDPYRWLEDSSSRETQEWTERQNELTRSILDARPERQQYLEQAQGLFGTRTVSAPARCGSLLFFTVRSASQDQPALWVHDLDTGEQRQLVDPNQESEGGLVALDWWYPSPDGSLVAFGLSEDGNEWSTLDIVETKTARRLGEAIPRTRFSSIAWEPDSKGFFYTRYPQPGEVPAGEESYHRAAFYHCLGRDWHDDPKLPVPTSDMRNQIGLEIDQQGRYLLASVGHGWQRSDLFLFDLSGPAWEPQVITRGEDALFTGRFGQEHLYIQHNRGNEYWTISRLDPQQPGEWTGLVTGDRNFVLQSFCLAGDKLLVHGLEHAASTLRLYSNDGSSQPVDLPGLGSVSFLSGEPGARRAFFSYTSFLTPPAIMALDTRTATASTWESSETPSLPEVNVERQFYTSKDGTQVPIYVLVPAEAGQGPRPTLLTGYGGFNVARTPAYAPQIIPWLRAGGIFALANLRGGSEYGESWHRSGNRERKQNVFDDFIAAAEYLLDQGYTTREQLGIEGRSNGGLLVGAALTQRPDLYGAVICGVPLLDMLRFHRFLIGALWTSEYGCADDSPEEFEWIYAYSPYHNVDPQGSYPPVYLHTATDDTRVHPSHARKMTALLQSLPRQQEPILLWTEAHAGHGVGKPVYKIIEEQADHWAFLAWQLGLSFD